MNKKSTDLKSARLPGTILGHPSLALLVSASLIGSARADQDSTLPTAPNSLDAAYASAQLQNRLLQTSDNLILPVNILDAHDSLLLRELLLTQGVELDLGSRKGFSRELIEELMVELQNDNLLSRALDIELLLDPPADHVVSLHSSIIYPENSADRTDRKNGVSKDWQILWLDPVVHRGKTSSTTHEKIRNKKDQRQDGVTSNWNVDLVLTRPATAEEIVLLEEKAAIAPESGAGLPAVMVPQVSSVNSGEVISGESTANSALAAEQPSAGLSIGSADSTSDDLSSPKPLSTVPEKTVTTQSSTNESVQSVQAKSPLIGGGEPSDVVSPPASSNVTPAAPGGVSLAASGGVTPAAPSGVTPDAPGGVAPDAPGGVAPDAPNGVTPTAPETVTPTLPFGVTPSPSGATLPPIPGSTESLAPPPGLEADETRAQTQALPDVVTDGIFSISDDVPPGFESLAGPQFLIVDVKYNGEIVGSVGITVTGDELTIDEPAELVALLPGVLEPERLIEELSLPLPANAHMICYALDDPPGCGQLVVDVAAVIYDESNLLLEVFVASNLQKVTPLAVSRYLPSPDSKNTSILSLYGTATDLPVEGQNVDLSARGLFGYGDGSVTSEVDYNTRTNRQRLNRLKLTHHFTDYELTAGSYSFQTRGALPDIDLLGVGFASSLKTRVDLEHAFSTELVVFLARRSVVQLIVDDRVYFAESYPAGNQVVDTRLLPDGTYDVEIRILDSQSGARVENRRFTKSTQLPPRGETLYHFTAGTPLLFNDNHIFPDTADVGVAGFSFARRLSDQSSYRLGLLLFGSNSFLQAEYTYLGEFISFQFSGSVGGESTRAASAQLGWFKDSLSLSLTAEHFSSEVDVLENPAFTQLYSNDFSQLTFSLNRSFKTFSVGGRWNYRESESVGGGDTSSLQQYALYYRRPLFQRRSLRGLLDVSVQQDEFDRHFGLQVKFFIDRGQWSSGLGAEVDRGEESGGGYNAGVTTRWRSSDIERYQWEAGFMRIHQMQANRRVYR